MEREIPFETKELQALRRHHRALLRAIPAGEFGRGGGTGVPAPKYEVPVQDRPVVEMSLRQLAEDLLTKNRMAAAYLQDCKRTLGTRLAREYLNQLGGGTDPLGEALELIASVEEPKADERVFPSVKEFAILTVLADRLAPDGYADSRFPAS
ncbi:MAG TPA: hypothetical protein VMQ81_11660 [Acidimicrobiia bacterium]|nr:hypothetical protein [Acidimicrobiia bacterium]